MISNVVPNNATEPALKRGEASVTSSARSSSNSSTKFILASTPISLQASVPSWLHASTLYRNFDLSEDAPLPDGLPMPDLELLQEASNAVMKPREEPRRSRKRQLSTSTSDLDPRSAAEDPLAHLAAILQAYDFWQVDRMPHAAYSFMLAHMGQAGATKSNHAKQVKSMLAALAVRRVSNGVLGELERELSVASRCC